MSLVAPSAPENRQTPTPLRVMMIAPTSFFSDYGGHIRILEETRHLQALGHQVAIVTYYKGDDLPGLDIRRTAPLPWRTEYEVGSSRHKIAFDVYLAAQAIVEARRLRPHVIHGHMHEGALIGGLLSRLLRLPLVFDFQGSLTGEMVDHQFLDQDGLVYPWAYRLEQFICRLPHAFLTSSHRAATLLQEEFSVPRARLHPLPDCADTMRFDPAHFSDFEKRGLRHRLGISPEATVIAYLGLLTDYQGTPHLIEAARRLQAAGENVHFLVMGYPNVDRFKRLAAKRGVADCMTFTGKIEYRDAPLYLSLGDIAVAPKVSATEGSGKVLNYMAMAQPIVAYDTAVHREYLGDLGVYAAPGDVADLSDALAQLVGDGARRTQLGHDLRQRAQKKYSWQHASHLISDVYSLLTSER